MKKMIEFWQFFHKYEKMGFVMLAIILVLCGIELMGFTDHFPLIKESIPLVLLFLVPAEAILFAIGRKRRRSVC